MKYHSLLTVAILSLCSLSFIGCPPARVTPPDEEPNPANVRAWSVWTENGREYTREVFNLEEVSVVAGDTAANFDFSGGNFVSGKIGYVLTDTSDMTYISVTPDSEIKYYGYPYGFYWNGYWYPDGYWYCHLCYGVWYHGPCYYHGLSDGHPYDINIDINLEEIIATLVENFPTTSTALTDNGEFSVTVPLGPTVETAVLNVETDNGSFVIIVRGEAYNQENNQQFNLSITTEGKGAVTGAGTYDAGTQVTVTATPENGWKFDHWKVNGTLAYNNPGVITMDSDVELLAVFVATTQTTYTLSITYQGQGTATGGGSYLAGTQATITATPSTGWKFDHWVVNGVNAYNNPGLVTMNSDVVVVAVFVSGAEPGGLIHVNLTWNGNVLSFSATGQSVGGVIGLELYHQVGGTPWIERQVFATISGTASGTLTKFRPNILRFAVVTDASSGGYVPEEMLDVKINNKVVPRVSNDTGQIAYQVNVSTL